MTTEPSPAPFPDPPSVPSGPLARVSLLLGPAAMERLASATVLVAGVGAVGATLAESLVRSGVRRLHLVDFDTIQPSNLNRHPFAFHSTIGLPKTEAASRFLRDIAPDLSLSLHPLFLDAATAPPLLAEVRPALLVDAIDSLLPKTELLLASSLASPPIPHILSCMGAARKLDPSLFRVTPLDATHTCPLARLLRKRLHRRLPSNRILAVWSPEFPAPLDEAPPPAPGDLHPRGRTRLPLPSYHPATSAAAAAAAAAAIRLLASPPVTA